MAHVAQLEEKHSNTSFIKICLFSSFFFNEGSDYDWTSVDLWPAPLWSAPTASDTLLKPCSLRKKKHQLTMKQYLF